MTSAADAEMVPRPWRASLAIRCQGMLAHMRPSFFLDTEGLVHDLYVKIPGKPGAFEYLGKCPSMTIAMKRTYKKPVTCLDCASRRLRS